MILVARLNPTFELLAPSVFNVFFIDRPTIAQVVIIICETSFQNLITVLIERWKTPSTPHSNPLILDKKYTASERLQTAQHLFVFQEQKKLAPPTVLLKINLELIDTKQHPPMRQPTQSQEAGNCNLLCGLNTYCREKDMPAKVWNDCYLPTQVVKCEDNPGDKLCEAMHLGNSKCNPIFDDGSYYVGCGGD